MVTTILVDGSNVLFWQGGVAQADVPERVVRALIARRFAPLVYFDNSIGRHIGQAALVRLETLAQVRVATAGTPADALLLKACEKGRIQIVSNDRFRTWRDDHPQLQAAWLVTGRIVRGGRVEFSKKLRPAPL
tara:strand:- start:18 stop:416 length:399 start_codon:yes stop_codon:yes gene_type:complete